MDFLKQEEKLIKSELTIRNTIKSVETLAKIDAILNKHKVSEPEKLSVDIKTAEHLSRNGKLKLPLRIRGTMLGVGRHHLKFYTADALRLSVQKYKGKRIPIKLDHRDREVGSTIGSIDSIAWSPKLNAITYKGHINDETHARNLLDGLFTDVSATIYSVKGFDNILGVIGTDLEYDEVSIVKEGAFKGSSIKLDI